jgi:hypothetical protein
MSERVALMLIHAGLFAASIGVGIAVIMVDPKLVAVNVTIGAAQAFFPNPWKPG